MVQENKNVRNLLLQKTLELKNKRSETQKVQTEKRYKDETVLPNLKIKKPEISQYDQAPILGISSLSKSVEKGTGFKNNNVLSKESRLKLVSSFFICRILNL